MYTLNGGTLQSRAVEAIRNLRLARDWSQEYVAFELAINQNTLSKIELGRTKLTLNRIEQFCQLYNVDVTTLLCLPPPEELVQISKPEMDSNTLNKLLSEVLCELRMHRSFDFFAGLPTPPFAGGASDPTQSMIPPKISEEKTGQAVSASGPTGANNYNTGNKSRTIYANNYYEYGSQQNPNADDVIMNTPKVSEEEKNSPQFSSDDGNPVQY